MSGNPDKASIWGDADVFVGFDLDAETPASVDVPFGLDWDLVGLLVRTSRRNFKLTRKFTALEENAVTLGLIWPGSGQGERRVPKVTRIKLAFETTDGEKVKRVITRRYAEISEVGTIKDSESELTKIEITVDIYPDADGVLFDVQPDDASITLASIAITPLTLALGVNDYGPLQVIATYSDASTVNVTAAAVFSTSAANKATVDRGYVKGVAAGTSNVGATFRGVEAPAPCVVTVS